ncbi:MAG: polyprenyl synthetase family protein [Ferruginibacter sp.]|nr:polyprenyl synthetase family protein [Ferruginibacter sp.]
MLLEIISLKPLYTALYCFFLRMDFVNNIIGEELKIFEKKFTDSVKSQTPLLDRIMKYIIKRKGKQLRPMFVFLSAKLQAPINESTYRAAALVEILHTATLVHDDVVDESLERRGFFSINAIWKNKIAVLVGDYLLSKGLLLSTSHNDIEHLHILSEAVRQMSEGELMQLEKARNLNLKEDIYFEIIRNKTASLLSSACAVGAWSTSKDHAIADRMKLFGEKVGIAFQIKDDLFDYGNEDIGKPTGNDIKEKKLTLPLIYTLNTIDAGTRRKLIYIVKNENKDAEKVRYVIDTVVKSGGISYASEKMNNYRNEAISILYEFPDNEVRKALEDLVRYTTDRKY